MLVASSSKAQSSEINGMLSSEFEMKDLGVAKKILGMEIHRDRAKNQLFLTQSKYIKKVLQRFNLHKAKVVTTPLGQHFRLSSDQAPSSDRDVEYMSKVPYASGVGSIMYVMVCSMPNLTYGVSMVSRFMANS